MNKKVKKITAAALCTVMAGCKKEVIPAEADVPYVEGKELFCLSKTDDEAEEIADLYGIELVEFQDGVAVFHTEEDVEYIIEKGKKNGWTELSPNTADTQLK